MKFLTPLSLLICIAAITLQVQAKPQTKPKPQAKPPTQSEEYPGYDKIFENDIAISLFQKNTAEVINRRSKVVGYTVVITFKERKALDAAYATTVYEANCGTGIITQTSEVIYNSKHGIIKGDSQRQEASSRDDSGYGRLRDRVCKSFGF